MSIDNSQFRPREKEVANLLLQGKSNKQIALALGISVSTVEFHLKNVYSKLQVSSRTEAVLLLGESIGDELADKPQESTVDRISAGVENDGHTIQTRRIPMKQQFYIIGSGLLVIILAAAFVFSRLATNNRLILPTQTSTMADTGISFAGTSFTIPSSLGDGTIDEYIQQSNDFMTPWHTRSILENYPLRDKVFEPQVLVYPMKEYTHMGKDSETTINDLQNILAAQRVSPAEPLPFLPRQNAAQLFHAQEKIFNFKNGTGIRYITQYSQAHFPAINNTDLFYTFQGITSDGKYYVSVILPINLASLAAKDDPEAWKNPAEWQTVEKYPDYLNTMINGLNQADNPFNPSLASLDALVQSLQVITQE
jgi:DNA-binding CsgD family transcriptional regulator